jgi:hypothetical protein
MRGTESMISGWSDRDLAIVHDFLQQWSAIIEQHTATLAAGEQKSDQ